MTRHRTSSSPTSGVDLEVEVPWVMIAVVGGTAGVAAAVWMLVVVLAVAGWAG